GGWGFCCRGYCFDQRFQFLFLFLAPGIWGGTNGSFFGKPPPARRSVPIPPPPNPQPPLPARPPPPLPPPGCGGRKDGGRRNETRGGGLPSVGKADGSVSGRLF